MGSVLRSLLGWPNFLHLCDVAVFLTCLGFAYNNALLLSSQTVSSLAGDLLWCLDAGWRWYVGRHLTGGTEYMWDARFPLWVRLLSLFHVVLPMLLLAALRRAGYDRRALLFQIGDCHGYPAGFAFLGSNSESELRVCRRHIPPCVRASACPSGPNLCRAGRNHLLANPPASRSGFPSPVASESPTQNQTLYGQAHRPISSTQNQSLAINVNTRFLANLKSGSELP